jgi:hypothetical protein
MKQWLVALCIFMLAQGTLLAFESRYDRATIEASGARTLAQFLTQATPLVALDNHDHNRPGTNGALLSTGGTGTQFGHEHIAIFFDGRRLDGSYRLGPDLSQIPLESVESITLTQSGGITKAGAGGSAAVIEIKSRDFKGVGTKLMAGEESARYLHLYAGGGNEVLTYNLFGSRDRQNPLYETNSSTPTNIRENIFGRLRFEPNDRFVLDLQMDGTRSYLHKPGHLSDDGFREDATQFSGQSATLEQRNGSKGFSIRWDLSEDLQLKGHLYETRHNPLHADVSGNEEAAIETIEQTRVALQWQPLKSTTLQSGYDRYRFHRYQSLESGDRDENIWWRSPWLRVDFEMAGHHLYGGYRQSKNHYNYKLAYFEGQAPSEGPDYIDESTRQEPKGYEAGYRWQIPQIQTTLFGTLQQGFDGYSAHTHRMRYYEQSVLEIDPKLTKSHQQRIGVRYASAPLLASLAAFENRWENRRYDPMAITLDPNLDESEAEGYEARIALIFPYYELRLNHQQTDATATKESHTPDVAGARLPGVFKTRSGMSMRFKWRGGYLQLAGYQLKDALPQNRYSGDHTHTPEDIQHLNLKIAHHLYGIELALLAENLQDEPQGFWAGNDRVYSIDPGRRIFFSGTYAF